MTVVAPVASWKLEDAKARFSELVRRAEQDGPQRVTIRGRSAVVVLSIADFDALMPDRPFVSIAEAMRGIGSFDGLDLTREPVTEREVEL